MKPVDAGPRAWRSAGPSEPFGSESLECSAPPARPAGLSTRDSYLEEHNF